MDIYFRMHIGNKVGTNIRGVRLPCTPPPGYILSLSTTNRQAGITPSHFCCQAMSCPALAKLFRPLEQLALEQQGCPKDQQRSYLRHLLCYALINVSQASLTSHQNRSRFHVETSHPHYSFINPTLFFNFFQNLFTSSHQVAPGMLSNLNFFSKTRFSWGIASVANAVYLFIGFS